MQLNDPISESVLTVRPVRHLSKPHDVFLPSGRPGTILSPTPPAQMTTTSNRSFVRTNKQPRATITQMKLALVSAAICLGSSLVLHGGPSVDGSQMLLRYALEGPPVTAQSAVREMPARQPLYIWPTTTLPALARRPQPLSIDRPRLSWICLASRLLL